MSAIVVRFRNESLQFWERKTAVQAHVASVAVAPIMPTKFPDQATAEKQVRLCRLDQAHITYHTVNK